VAQAIQTLPLVEERWLGLYKRLENAKAPLGSCREARNVDFFQSVASKRGGTHKINLTPAAGRVHGLKFAIFRSGPSFLLGLAGIKVQQLDVDPPVDLTLSLPAATPARVGTIVAPSFVELSNLVFIADGQNLDIKVDATKIVTMLGIRAPTLAPTDVLVAGTLPAGVYIYRFTYVNSATQAESEGSPPLSVTVNGVQAPVITAAASPDPQVTATRLYRTTVGGDGIWLFDQQINSNGGAFAADNLPDTGLGIQMDEFLNEPPPGPMRLLASWPQAFRLLGVPENNPSLLYYTDLKLARESPESWPPLQFVPVNFDDGDEIVGVQATYDSVIICKKRSTWRLRGLPGDPTALRLEPVHWSEDQTGIGAWSQPAMVAMDNNLFIPALDGGYFLARTDDGLGFEGNRISILIDAFWQEVNPGTLRKGHGVFHRQRRQLRLWRSFGTAEEPDQALIFQLEGAADGQPNGWSWWDVPATASTVAVQPTGDVVYIGTADGFILIMDEGAEDGWTGDAPGNGTAYPYELELSFFLPDPARQTEWRGRMLDLVMQVNSTVDLVVTPESDLGSDWPPIPLHLVPQGFILDTDPPSIPGAGILDGVDAMGNPLGQGTVKGDVISTLIRTMFLARGRWYSFRFMEMGKGTSFGIETLTFRGQPLSQKTVTPAALQALP